MTREFRDSYLSAMGVAQWYARKRLLGAASSPEFTVASECDFASSPDVELRDSSLFGGTVLPGKALNQIDKIAELVAEPPTALTAKQIVSTVTPNEPQQEVEIDPEKQTGSSKEVKALPPFTLRRYQAGRLAITTESSETSPRAKEIDILTNILNACSVRSTVSYQSCFSWPVFASLGVPGSAGADYSSLIARWLIEGGAASVYLHFGSVVGGDLYSVPSGGAEGNSATSFQLPYSLVELIDMPSKKAAVWDAILPHINKLA